MLFKISWVGALLFSVAAQAETFRGKVVEVDEPVPGDDRYLVFLEDGTVLKTRKAQAAQVLEGAQLADEYLKIEFAPSSTSDHIRRIQREEPEAGVQSLEADAAEFEAMDAAGYVPTDLGSKEAIDQIFGKLTRKTTKDSICANRAQIWAYRMWKDHGVKSMKAFLFFTKKYIRQHNGKWWYHVTPYTMAGQTQYATDRSFFKSSRELSAWATYFVGGRYNCKYISRYQEYKDGEYKEYCYVRRVPMTVWMPWGVRRLDTGEAPPSDFVASQVKQAWSQALTPAGQREFDAQGW